MSVKLLTEHHLEFLRLTGGCTGSSESALVKIPHCWKSRVTAHMLPFFPRKVSHMKIKLRQYVSDLKSPNFDAANIISGLQHVFIWKGLECFG